MMVCLLGLLRTERLASDMSAVTLVMDILKTSRGHTRSHLRSNKRGRWPPPPFLPALKLVFQKVEERLLHHVRHLKAEQGVRERSRRVKCETGFDLSPYFVSFERRPDQDDGSHGGDHVIGRDVLHLSREEVRSDPQSPHRCRVKHKSTSKGGTRRPLAVRVVGSMEGEIRTLDSICFVDGL